MAQISQTYAPFDTVSVVPPEAGFSGLAKESIIQGRTTGVMVRPQSGTTYNLASAGQSINLSINSSRFVDLSKLRMLCTVQVLDVSGAAVAADNRMVLESGLSLFNNCKTQVSGVEVDNVNFAASLASMLTRTTGHSDYHLSQGQLNGDFISTVDTDPTIALANGASNPTFTGMGNNLGPQFAQGIPVAIDLSFLGTVGMARLFPGRYFGRLDFQLILNSGVQACVAIRPATISPFASCILTNVRFVYDEVDLNPTYVKALDAYLSNPANSITLPVNSFQVQRVALPSASQVSNTIAVARKYVKTILTSQRNPAQNNTYSGATQGYAKWNRHACFGRYGEQLQLAGLYYPITLHQDRADLLAYTMANTNAWGDALGAGVKLNPWSYGVLPFTATDGGSTILGTEKDYIAPSVAYAEVAGAGRKLMSQVVVHSLEAQANPLSDDELSGIDTGSLGATIAINTYYDGGATTVPPTAGGEMYVAVEYGAMVKLQGKRVSVVSV